VVDGHGGADRGGTDGQSSLDRGISAGLLGCFAVVWFGFAVAGPIAGPARGVLAVAMVMAGAVALTGAIDAVRSRAEGSVVQDPVVSRRYWLVFTVQVLIAGAGALILGLVGAGEFILTWITVVVGGHFVPLARLLRDPLLGVLGICLMGACALAVVMHSSGHGSATTITGTTTGTLFVTNALSKIWPRSPA
jgi:hypothetical protein